MPSKAVTSSHMAIGRENYFWHKLHSLTGIIPIGFYMIQHLVLNSFSFAGPEKFPMEAQHPIRSTADQGPRREPLSLLELLLLVAGAAIGLAVCRSI